MPFPLGRSWPRGWSCATGPPPPRAVGASAPHRTRRHPRRACTAGHMGKQGFSPSPAFSLVGHIFLCLQRTVHGKMGVFLPAVWPMAGAFQVQGRPLQRGAVVRAAHRDVEQHTLLAQPSDRPAPLRAESAAHCRGPVRPPCSGSPSAPGSRDGALRISLGAAPYSPQTPC